MKKVNLKKKTIYNNKSIKNHQRYKESCVYCGSVVVDFLFIVNPLVGVCNCSMFCFAARYFMSILVLQSS